VELQPLDAPRGGCGEPRREVVGHRGGEVEVERGGQRAVPPPHLLREPLERVIAIVVIARGIGAHR
jgi:hypothetical protein